MQTFLPYANIKGSLEVLDNKRLGKQRVEAFQILNVLFGKPTKSGRPYKGWLNHPCVTMWKGYENILTHYYNTSIDVWVARGFKNTMEKFDIDYNITNWPMWFGNEAFHASHRSNLLRKDYQYYSQFGWNDDPEDPYVWIDKENNFYRQKSGTNIIEYV